MPQRSPPLSSDKILLRYDRRARCGRYPHEFALMNVHLFERHTRMLMHMLPSIAAGTFRKTTRALDVGCNTGYLTNIIAQRYEETVGVELSPPLVARAKEKYPHLSFYIGDAQSLPFGNAHFDDVFLLGVLPLVESLEGVFIEAARVLNDGGNVYVLIYRTPSLGEILVRSIGSVLAGRRSINSALHYAKKRLYPPPVPDFENCPSLSLQRVLAAAGGAGLAVEQIHSPRKHWLFKEEELGLVFRKSKMSLNHVCSNKTCSACLK